MQLIPLTTEGAELLKELERKEVSALMGSLTLAQCDAIRRFINGRGIIGTHQNTLNSLIRRGIIERKRRIGRSMFRRDGRRVEVTLGYFYTLTRLGYQLAWEFGFMGSYNAYAHELAVLSCQV